MINPENHTSTYLTTLHSTGSMVAKQVIALSSRACQETLPRITGNFTIEASIPITLKSHSRAHEPRVIVEVEENQVHLSYFMIGNSFTIVSKSWH